jgi:hypothetical protein
VNHEGHEGHEERQRERSRIGGLPDQGGVAEIIDEINEKTD